MSEMFRLRVDKSLLKEAHKVSAKIGTSTGELVRIFLKQMVRRQAVPFSLTADDEILAPRKVRAKAIEAFYGDEPAYK